MVNPAVRPGNPLLALAARGGAIISTEIELLLDRCPAPVVGITGSTGKSTTATLLAAMLRADGQRAWLGGNIGGSLLDSLPRSAGDQAADSRRDTIADDEIVVLELSSFQLSRLADDARWPRWAIVTNCGPNHLDWHGDFASYAAAKRRLVGGASEAVLLGDDLAAVPEWTSLINTKRLIADASLLSGARLSLMGEHNRANAIAAATMAQTLGVAPENIRRTAREFEGLEHRLRRIATVDDREFYDDSKATSPAAAIAALAAIERPRWWLAGGDVKGAPLDALAAIAVRGARGAAVFGRDRAKFADALREADAAFPLHVCEQLAEALEWCWQASSAGDAIVLSPAAASLDQFADFADRGRCFARLVAAIGSRHAQRDHAT